MERNLNKAFSREQVKLPDMVEYFQKLLENNAVSPLFTVCRLCDVWTKRDAKTSFRGRCFIPVLPTQKAAACFTLHLLHLCVVGFHTNLWRSGCSPAPLSVPPQTAPWNVSARVCRAGTEGPSALCGHSSSAGFRFTLSVTSFVLKPVHDTHKSSVGIRRKYKKKSLKSFTIDFLTICCHQTLHTGPLKALIPSSHRNIKC